MKCLHPILIKGKRDQILKVRCGQCIACRLNRAQEWTMRLMDELKSHPQALFLTLTYNEENLPRVNEFYATLVKDDVQGFFKRLRKNLKGVKIRYYLCGEYGGNYGRPHYHAILFFYGDEISQSELERIIENCWNFGYVYIGNVTVHSCAYVAKYCTKLLTGPKAIVYNERNIIPEFSLMSRRPGIGGEHCLEYAEEYRRLKKKRYRGRDVNVPRYYKDKVYTDNERIFERAAMAVAEAMRLEKWNERVKEQGYERVVAYDFQSEEQREHNLITRLGLKKRRKC